MSQKKYSVSVITPLHNSDITIFRRAYDSIMAQTIGQENIEWIIVVHNSDDEKFSAVREITDHVSWIKVYALNDGKNTPSAPRNYALDRSNAEYIAFLDADDSYDPDYLRTALSAMKETKSDLMLIRRKGIVENSSYVFDELCDYDASDDVLTVEKDGWDDKKTFGCLRWEFATSKVIKKALFDEKSLRFDERIPYGESATMSIELVAHAKKVCFVPGYVGYNYYIHNDSIVQNVRKNSKEIGAIAQGIGRIFRIAEKNNALTDRVVLLFSSLCAVYALYSDISIKDRTDLKTTFAPYLGKIVGCPYDESYPAEYRKIITNLAKEVLLRPEYLSNNIERIRKRYKSGRWLTTMILFATEIE